MTQEDCKDLKPCKKTSTTKKTEKKVDLAIIKTAASSPIQEILCKEEHKKLFENLCEWKQ